MKSETLIYGEELLVILDETGEISFKQLEEKFEIKGDELRGLLKYLVKKEYISWKMPLFVNTDFISDDKIKLANKGMEVVLGKRDYFTEGEKVVKKKNKIGVIFDSNIYDLIADGTLNISLLSAKKDDFEFYITHIQIDEINKCSDEDKRARLFLFKSKVSPVVIPTESFILGTSRLGEAKLGDGKILEEIRKENLNHTEDALIGETAIKKNLLLVTEDSQLKNKVNSLNGKAISLREFKESLR
ncbi:hypothetical protein HYT26_03030 [Candidatus Pacearchaeota archaeon]|nr:hypothetical protein [Candidatus Pacearchaeota archaeon]